MSNGDNFPIHKTSQPSLAFVTCYFGGDDSPSHVIGQAPCEIKDAKASEIKCFYFTNSASLYRRLVEATEGSWTPIWCGDIPVYGDRINDTMASKELRCCPERFDVLSPFEYVCWMDSKLRLSSWERFLEMWQALQQRDDRLIAATAHPITHDTVWGEYDVGMSYSHYGVQAAQARAYVERQLTEGRGTLRPGQRICCGFRLQRTHDPRRRDMGARWLSAIHECGMEDQISFQFIHQQFPDAVEIFPYQRCWKYLHE